MGADADYRIKFLTTADTAGVDDITDRIGKLGDKTQETGEASSKLVEELGGMRESQRVARDLFNILGEGGNVVEGLTGLVRVLLATSEGLNPELLAISIVASSLIGIYSQFAEKADTAASKQKDLAEGTGDLNKQFDELKNKETDKVFKLITDSVTAELTANRDLIESYVILEGYEKTRTADLLARIEATTKLNLATLENQKITELGNATSPAQREAIEARYKGREAAVTAGSDDEKYEIQRKAIIQEAAATADELRATNEQARNARSDFEKLQDRANSTAASASKAGIEPDVLGSYDDALKAAQAQKEAAQAEYTRQTKAGANEGELNHLAYVVQKAIVQAKVASDADQAQKALQGNGSKLAETFNNLTASAEKLQNMYAHLLSQRDTQAVDRNTQKQTENKASTEAGNDEKKAERDARDRDLEIQQNNLEKNLNLNPNDPTIEAALQRTKDQRVRNKSDDTDLTNSEVGKDDAQFTHRQKEQTDKTNKKNTEQEERGEGRNIAEDLTGLTGAFNVGSTKGQADQLRAVGELIKQQVSAHEDITAAVMELIGALTSNPAVTQAQLSKLREDMMSYVRTLKNGMNN